MSAGQCYDVVYIFDKKMAKNLEIINELFYFLSFVSP
jgi:hypothetical protein